MAGDNWRVFGSIYQLFRQFLNKIITAYNFDGSVIQTYRRNMKKIQRLLKELGNETFHSSNRNGNETPLKNQTKRLMRSCQG